MDEVLTDRQLNRATLARQMLLERSEMGIEAAVAWLLGLQAQQTHDPYIGLWARLGGFRHEDLTALIVGKHLARATTMRGTLHLHAPDDLIGIRALVEPFLKSVWQSQFGKRFGDNEKDKVLKAAIRLIDEGPTTAGDLGKRLKALFPTAEPLSMTMLLQSHETLVQVPPTRIWGSGHAPMLARIEHWLPAPYERPLSREDLVRRYLAAYGPASVADMQSWSRLTKLAASFIALGDELVRFKAADGRVLYDLAEAPRPPADTPAPVRFLPLYDNVYLGYDNRRRMLTEADMKRINLFADFKPAVLIDGVIAAGWTIATSHGKALLEIEPYHKPTRAEVKAAEEEGAAFVRFMQEDATDFDVRVLPVREA